MSSLNKVRIWSQQTQQCTEYWNSQRKISILQPPNSVLLDSLLHVSDPESSIFAPNDLAYPSPPW